MLSIFMGKKKDSQEIEYVKEISIGEKQMTAIGSGMISNWLRKFAKRMIIQS